MDAKIDIWPGSLGKAEEIDSTPFFKFILENAGETCIILMDENGYILCSNIAVKMALGYSPEDLGGKHFSMLFTEEDRKKGLPDIELKNVHKRGRASDRNFITHRNSAPIWVHGESVLVRDGNGKVFIVKMIYDINEQKLLEASLYKANEDLMQVQADLKQKNDSLIAVNKDLDTFVYTASHDLKSPLNNLEALITGLISELSEKSREKEEVGDMINMIRQSLDNFKDTINDLANIGKAQQEGRDDNTIIRFAECMEEVKTSLSHLVEANDARIIENFNTAPEIKMSRRDLRSILYNLVSNSIKHRAKERKPVVKVSSTKTDENLILLKVEDNGLGISEEDQLKLFGMYQRFNTEVEGTGVGLSLIKKIVEKNGGRIEVESELGKGSVFSILLKK